MTNLSVVLNSSLPSFASMVLEMLGSFVCNEGGFTSRSTKRYMLRVISEHDTESESVQEAVFRMGELSVTAPSHAGAPPCSPTS